MQKKKKKNCLLVYPSVSSEPAQVTFYQFVKADNV